MIAPNLKDCEQILLSLLEISNKYKLDRPYVFGGRVRDVLFKKDSSNSDLDITTNSQEAIRLGVLFSFEKKELFRMFEDRHLRVVHLGKGIDFTSSILSFSHPGLFAWFKENIDKDISTLESYGRDFTINSMNQDIESGEILDLTDMGLEDFEKKILRCPAPPEITIRNDPRRIFRGIRLCSELGLTISPDIIDYVRQNKEILSNHKITPQFMTTEINRAFGTNSEVAIGLIDDFDIFKIIPLSGAYSQYLVKNKLLSKYLS